MTELRFVKVDAREREWRGRRLSAYEVWDGDVLLGRVQQHTHYSDRLNKSGTIAISRRTVIRWLAEPARGRQLSSTYGRRSRAAAAAYLLQERRLAKEAMALVVSKESGR